MNPTVEVLTRARALVARGWVQYTGHSIRGVCAAYAIMAVAQDAMLDYANPVLVFLTAMRQETKTHWPDIPGWNDMPGRTQAEVLAMFDKAIELATPHPAPPPVHIEVTWEPVFPVIEEKVLVGV